MLVAIASVSSKRRAPAASRCHAIGKVYYRRHPSKLADIKLDYQPVGKPGYNRDHEPAIVVATRLDLHA